MKGSLFGAALFAVTVFGHAMADDGWRLSGFGTVGAVTTSDSEASLFRNGISTPGRDGVDFGPDSILGVQINRQIDNGIDLTAQVIVREDQSSHVEPRLAWAFARFTPLADLELRLGRLRSPFFMYSDSIWINYANIWARPPQEVYGLNPFTDLDGADLMWRTWVTDIDLEVRPFFGRSILSLPNRKAELKRIYGLNLTAHYGSWSVFAGHAESPFSLPWGDAIFNAIDAGLRSSPFAAVADDLSGKDGYARFDAIGFQWDSADYFVSAEYARRAVNRYTTSAHGWYVTVGSRIGLIAPYLMFARQIEDGAVTSADLTAAPPLKAGLDAFLESRNTAQRSATIGLRWDVHRNAAIKVEFTHAHLDQRSWGGFFQVGGNGFISLGGRRISVLGASVDLSF